MKGGMGRLDKIMETIRHKRAEALHRTRELDELLEMCLELRNKPEAEPVDSIGE